MILILIILAVLFLFGGLPTWGYHSYGYAPSGVALVVFVILLVVLMRGRL